MHKGVDGTKRKLTGEEIEDEELHHAEADLTEQYGRQPLVKFSPPALGNNLPNCRRQVPHRRIGHLSNAHRLQHSKSEATPTR